MSFQTWTEHLDSNRVRCNTWPGIRKASSPEGKPSSRVNVWGSRSYADLITQAIVSSHEQRLTLIEIYEWMIENVPYFRQKSDKANSAGWKNSIRHNLSLHSKFVRVQNEVAGKSSWWTVNHQVKEKTGRRRCATMDGQRAERKRHSFKKKAETLRKIEEGTISNFSWNNNNPVQPNPAYFQPTQSTTSYVNNIPPVQSNVQADQNYNHMVTTFQCGMTLYYPSESISHRNNMPAVGNTALSGSVQTENSTNLDDPDLNPIRLPFDIDVEAIIRKELEIDGMLDFV